MLKQYNNDFFEINDISPYMLGWGHYMKSIILWWTNELEQITKPLEQFLQFKFQSASNIVMDAYFCLAMTFQEFGRSEEADAAINNGLRYTNDLQDPGAQAMILSGQARLNLLKGNIKSAEDWLSETEAIPLNPTMFFLVEIPSITRCRVLIAGGKKEDLLEALELLDEYRTYSESIFNKMRTIDILVLQTLAYNKLTKEDEAMSILREAVEMSANGKWIRPFAEQEREISGLLLRVKEEGVQPAFIDTIFAAVETNKNSADKAAESMETLAEEKLKGKPTIFTHREFEVLKGVSEGLRNQEIADKLFVSDDTIKKHIYHMFQKMHVKNRLSLITKAKEERILE
jgi:ATP/maltotriose-dependent transcriptional regulator MalT